MNDITDHSTKDGLRGPGHRGSQAAAALTEAAAIDSQQAVSISCDDCSMQCTAACDDCVVTFLVGQDDDESLVLDLDQARVVRLLGSAGLVPDLKFRVAG